MKRKRFLVVGLGILGESVARTLSKDGAEVIAIDSSPKLVDQIKDAVEVAAQCDVTDRTALEQLGIKEVDGAVVCIGENFESAVLATANLLDIGVKHVSARANSRLGASILGRLGVQDVFFVESAMGKVIAHRLNQPDISHEMEIGGGYRIVQWEVPQKMAGKNLYELALNKHYHVQVIAIRNEKDQRTMKTPTAETVIQKNDLLVLAGHEERLRKFYAKWKPSSSGR